VRTSGTASGGARGAGRRWGYPTSTVSDAAVTARYTWFTQVIPLSAIEEVSGGKRRRIDHLPAGSGVQARPAPVVNVPAVYRTLGTGIAFAALFPILL